MGGVWCSILCCLHGSGRLAVPMSHTLSLSQSLLWSQVQAWVKEKGSLTPKIT